MPELVDLLSPTAFVQGGGVTAKPTRPGTVIGFAGAQTTNILPAASDVVAIPIVTDWGPIGSDPAGSNGLQGGPQEVQDFAGYASVYGDSDTPGRTAAVQCFAGQNLPGLPGSGGAIFWRMAGSAAAFSTASVTSTAGGAPATLAIKGYYKGSRGNRISYSIDNNPADSTQDRVRIYFDGRVQESYVYDPTGGDTAASLAAAINKVSRLVTVSATLPNSTSRLTQTPSGAPVALANGNDGSTVLSADHLAALEGLQYKSFGLIAPYDLTDSQILASYASWVATQREANRPVRLVVGGAAGEDVGTAVSRSVGLADEHIVNLGCGTYHDDLLDKDLSTSQLAPRLAGILAAKGERHAATFAKIGGLHTVVGPADDEVEFGMNNGVVLIVPATSPDADVRIEKSVTTYTADTTSKPLDVYGDPRLIAIMDDYVRSMKEWGDDTIIGDHVVNDDTRALVRGHARGLQDDLLRDGLILPANPDARPEPIPEPWVVCVDPQDEALEDAIPYTFGWRFAKTANNIIGQGAIA